MNLFLRILKLLGIKHSPQHAKDVLLSHSDYPSLLSIADSLDHYCIENAAVQIGKERLSELPLPCIAQVMVQTDERIPTSPWFYVVEAIDNGKVFCYNHENKRESILLDEFIKKWTGVTLLTEKKEASEEPEYAERAKKKVVSNILFGLTIVSALIWFIFLAMGKPTIPIIYFLMKLLGLFISVLLLWYEVDKFNPTLQKFCSGSKKMSCETVLNSRFAQILGGQFSLSAISFSYFSAGILLLVFSSFSNASFSLLGNIGLLTSPVIIYSIYSQAFIIKRWCKFCLMVLGALLMENILYFVSGFPALGKIEVKFLSIFITFFFFFVFTWHLIQPLFLESKRAKLFKRSLLKIKSNVSVFESLLAKSRKIENNPKGLGIFLKSERPKYHILKVCNPYCGPCAQAHPILEKLFEKGIIDLQILFTASENENDLRTRPVKHLMAIESKGNEQQTRKALDDWYLPNRQDYGVFSQLYPMNGELNKQSEKIRAMHEWCEKENIVYTPSIFINGYELPKEYDVDDLFDLLGGKNIL